jgi:deoxycytidylate deaminase
MRYLQGLEAELAATFLDLGARLARADAFCHRSRCGAVIVDTFDTVIGRGVNSPPGDERIPACVKDALPAGFASDRTCCIHAEQRAILDATRRYADRLPGSTLYFIRLDARGDPMAAEEPYCTICSKAALDARIGTFVLRHSEGIAAYDAREYNERSFGRIPSSRRAP